MKRLISTEPLAGWLPTSPQTSTVDEYLSCLRCGNLFGETGKYLKLATMKIQINETSHYGLRLIESGYSRFFDFASHFIYLQIFQKCFSTERLILSASKYSRFIFWGRNALFFIGTRQEKGRVECFVRVSNIFPRKYYANIWKKNICYFKSPI